MRTRKKFPSIFLGYFPQQQKRRLARPQLWGYVQGRLPVFGFSLADRERYQLLSAAEQQSLLYRKLRQVKKKGAIACGLPDFCRRLLDGRAPLPVPDGRPLAAAALLEKIELEWHDLKGKDIFLEGVDGMWALGVADYLSSAGAWLSLSGRKAQQVAGALYEKRGVVLPVGDHAAPYRLCLFPGQDESGQVYHLTDCCVPVPGDWFAACPFPQGQLPASLAAAVALAGEKPCFPS